MKEYTFQANTSYETETEEEAWLELISDTSGNIKDIFEIVTKDNEDTPKTLEDREADFRQVFSSLLTRINYDKAMAKKIVITDKKLDKAVKDYCKTYKDEVIYK